MSLDCSYTERNWRQENASSSGRVKLSLPTPFKTSHPLILSQVYGGNLFMRFYKSLSNECMTFARQNQESSPSELPVQEFPGLLLAGPPRGAGEARVLRCARRWVGTCSHPRGAGRGTLRRGRGWGVRGGGRGKGGIRGGGRGERGRGGGRRERGRRPRGKEREWEERQGREGTRRGGVCKLSVRGHCGKQPWSEAGASPVSRAGACTRLSPWCAPHSPLATRWAGAAAAPPP